MREASGANCEEAEEKATLRSLTDAPALVKRVRQLNLGVLPVQCPEFCYKRAARDPHELSWAATMSTASDSALVAGSLVAEYEPLNRAVHVRTLAVAPRFRRQGLARRLVAKLVQQARRLRVQVGEQQLESVRLHVHVGNEDALAFYECMGFRQEARLEDYYRHLEPRACLVMSYVLGDAAAGSDGNEESKDE